MVKVIQTGFGVLAAGVVCSLQFPHARLWGVHFLTYYPYTAQVAFLTLAAVVLVVGLTRVPWRKHAVKLPALTPLQWDVLIAACCGLLFLLFSSATALLGDGQLWLNEIQTDTSDYLKNRAPFTLLLLHTLYDWLNPLTGISAMRTFAIVSVIAGAACVLGWLTLARHLHIGRPMALLMGFSWGGVAFFCGYVETYVIATSILTWVLVLAIISLRKDEPSLFVPVLGVLAVGFSLAAVVFLPAVIAYTGWMFSRRPMKPQTVFLFTGGALILALVAYFAFGWYKGNDLLLPLVPSSAAFGDAVFTLRHVADLVNSLVLAAGAFIVLFVAYIVAKRESGFQWNTEKLILLLALMFPLAALIVHNPQLGMARDWDIGAMMLLAAPLVSMVMWDSIRPFITSTAIVQASLSVWLLLVILPWVGLQASETRSMQRFTDLLRLDAEKSESGWDYLSSYYLHRGRFDEWAQCNFEALKLSGNPRHHANAALYFCMKRQWTNARYHAALAHAAAKQDSVFSRWEASVTDPGAILNLGKSYLERAFVGDARQTFAVAAVLQPESAWPDVALAEMYLRMRDLDQARGAIGDLTKKGRPQLDAAWSYFHRCAEKPVTDQQISGWMGMSLIAEAEGKTADAEVAARRAFDLSKDAEIGKFIAALQTQTAGENR